MYDRSNNTSPGGGGGADWATYARRELGEYALGHAGCFGAIARPLSAVPRLGRAPSASASRPSAGAGSEKRRPCKRSWARSWARKRSPSSVAPARAAATSSG
jgi:hypothetical protein